MHIQLESHDINAIRSYDEVSVLINGITYCKSLFVSPDQLISEWNVHHPDELNVAALEPVMQLKPEIILIASKDASPARFAQIQNQMHKNRIALEVMSHDAAYRTYNVLLSEGRSVVLCIIYA